MMGSGAETVEETINSLNKARRQARRSSRSGCTARSTRRPSTPPFRQSVKKIAVLDRTKEPGALGEPLYLDVAVALSGRSSRSSAAATGCLPRNSRRTWSRPSTTTWTGRHARLHGRHRGRRHGDLPPDRAAIDTELPGTVRCKFWGYGSDGTVGANKNSITIIGDNTDMYAQGYFQYDSKKSGGVTISHLRFGKSPIQSQYLVDKPDFVALHKIVLYRPLRHPRGHPRGRRLPHQRPPGPRPRSSST